MFVYYVIGTYKDMNKKSKTPAFENSIAQLEEIVTALEAGDLSLEESLTAFEQGIKITKDCQKQLRDAEQKITQLVGDGEHMQLIDFEEESE